MMNQTRQAELREREFGNDSIRDFAKQKAIRASLKRAWRDCADCVSRDEFDTGRCAKCFADPSRPDWVCRSDGSMPQRAKPSLLRRVCHRAWRWLIERDVI